MKRKIALINSFLIAVFLTSSLFAKGEVLFTVSSSVTQNAKTLFFSLYLDEEPSKAYVAYLGKRYPFFKKPDGDGYYSLIPTSYYQKPKDTDAVIVYIIDGKKHYLKKLIHIEEGDYKRESLRVDPSKAKLSKRDKRRVAKELKEAKRIYNTYTPTLYITEPFILPIDSKITSDFGNKRVFNSILKSYHSGTDFRAKRGTPIVASNSGRVVLVKNRFFAGNSVIIDHGEGIYSGYYHLSKFAVKKGQMVRRGEVIGYAGATGRVTGPHLHYTIHVGGVCVDPLQFTDVVNEGLFF
jgi:murein DD-endopeptidase MepM/ murein hydrolase activator NlpD